MSLGRWLYRRQVRREVSEQLKQALAAQEALTVDALTQAVVDASDEAFEAARVEVDRFSDLVSYELGGER